MRRAADSASCRLRVPLLLVAVAVLSACAGPRKAGSPDTEPTLASLAGRSVPVDTQRRIATSEAEAMAAYQAFLATPARAADAQPRAEAMRRLGDLELDRAEAAAEALPAAAAGGAPAAGIDTRAAMARYQDRLKAFPADPRNDQVLYQLARAQELGGDLPAALQTLDRLVADHPRSVHRAEAQFRRGELLFNARRYSQAEAAYADVLTQDAPLRDRALYMLGWSQFKQSRLPEALQAFFAVLDSKWSPAAGPDGARQPPGGLERDELAHLGRGDRELLDDTLRVMSISLASLQGAASIPPFIDREERRRYEARVYQELGELYIRQERVKDAADTFSAFTRRQPLHAQAPVLQARVIEIYEQGGFASLALDAKRDYVTRYGPASEFRRLNPAGWASSERRVQQHLDDLARFHHAAAQKARAARDPATAGRETQEAIRWYAAYVEGFPQAATTPERHFLMAELLGDDQRIAESASAFEQVAYRYPVHVRSAEAGYAAVLARRAVAGEPGSAGVDPASPAARLATDSAVRFATTFPADPRATAVLTDASDRLMRLGDLDGATRIARQVLAGGAVPPAGEQGPARAAATPDQRRVALTVLGQAAFERRDYAAAEAAYAEALATSAAVADGRSDAGARRQRDLSDRLAAAVYRQGEAARQAGQPAAAIGHFDRAVRAAPGSSIAAAAEFDAATVRVEQKDWDGAAQALEAFRQRHAQHALQAEVPARLALVQMERGQWAAAAGEFERLAAAPSPAAIAAAGGDREAVSRSALYQASELHERGGDRARAAQALDRYVRAHPQPVDAAVEARWRLVELLRAEPGLASALGPMPASAAASASAAAAEAAARASRTGNRAGRTGTAGASPSGPASTPTASARLNGLLRDIVEADASAGDARTDRTRSRAGLARLALTEPQWEAYRQVALVEPLQRNLALKKQRMESLLSAYAAAGGDNASAEVTTAATARTAALYQDFGQALMASQRPRGLKPAALEQYNVMLEEQAFPFEEKAIELHEANARRTTQGLYDESIRQSLAALATLKPVRWGKAERGEAAPAGETAIARAERLARLQQAAAATPGDARVWARLGLAQRQAGRFADARQAYERALELDDQLTEPLLNLAILHDLYLADAPRAAALYERYAARVPAEAATVTRWLAELRQRQSRVAADARPAPSGPQAQAPRPLPETAR